MKDTKPTPAADLLNFDFEPSKQLEAVMEKVPQLGAKDAILLAMSALEQARSEAQDADCPEEVKNPDYFDFEAIAGFALFKMYVLMTANVAWDEASRSVDVAEIVEQLKVDKDMSENNLKNAEVLRAAVNPERGKGVLMTEDGTVYDMRSPVADYYRNKFPEDTDGIKELDKCVTFGDVFRCLKKGKNVYQLLGVEESDIREKVLEALAQIKGCDYDRIYKMWLRAQ